MLKILCSSLLIAGASAACDTTKVAQCAADMKVTCDGFQTYLDCLTGADCVTQEQCDAFNKQIEAISSCDVKCSVGCFPASSTVELENGQTKYMEDLLVGEKVRVGPGPKDFSEVFYFSTTMADTSAKFVKITTESTELSLTSGHYLYANGQQVQAGDVKVGDTVVLANGTSTPVTAVGSLWGPGLYNPHTLHGDIMVDGVRTTTYTAAVHPKLAHALLSPLRMMYSAGLSFGSGFQGLTKGLPSWVLQAINA